MNLNDTIKSALTTFFQENYPHLDVAEVTDWEDTTLHDGYCETCYYEYAGVRITYVDSAGRTGTYEYGDSFSSLISGL